MGITMGIITTLEDRGRIVVPKELRDRAGLKPGQKVLVEMEDDSLVIRKVADISLFSQELKGCIKKSRISPLEMKRIWEKA